MLDGVFLVDKPAGMTSARALDRLKRQVKGLRKLGHAGTLDPLGTGLLVCLAGKATRLAQYAEAGLKEYEGLIRLGVTTESDDIEGRVLTQSPDRPSEASLEAARKTLAARRQQRPPAVSALKIDGERAYRRQRRGEEVSLDERTIDLRELELSLVDADHVRYRVRCGKGLYVRALARDCGELLGCGACIETLRRTVSLPFHIDQAAALEEIGEKDLLCWSVLFQDTNRFNASDSLFGALLSGDVRALKQVPRSASEKKCIFCDSNGKAAGLLFWSDDQWRFGVNVGIREREQGEESCQLSLS